MVLIHIQDGFFEEKDFFGEKSWGVNTLVTGHYHPWGDKEPQKKIKRVYLDKGSDSFKTTW